MFRIGARVPAIALAALMAFGVPALAQHRGGGGGGAPVVRGGGAPAFHGGGAPAFRGGGTPVFRGGGVPAFRGSGRTFSPSFARPAFRGGAIRHPFIVRGFRGSRTFARPTIRGRGTIGALRRTTGRAAFRRAPSRGGIARITTPRTMRGIRTVRPFAPASARSLARAGARSATAAHRFRRGHWGRYRQRYAWYAWAGPVFWPYAYDDLFDDIFWGYGPVVYYDDLFWNYGYGDIYGALFSPYGYDDFYAYQPPTRARRAGTGATALAAVTPSEASPWASLCGDDARDVVGPPIDRIRDGVKPDEAQRASLDALAEATLKAAQTIKSACPKDIALTPPGRLKAVEQRLNAMAQAVDIMRPPLETFYNSLSDEQKERFNALARKQTRDRRGREQRTLAETCSAPAVFAWPQEQIEQTVKPTETQRASLAGLEDAAGKAADTLKSACPSELPVTPPARLAAVSDRINAMLAAVRTVRTALDAFYGSLSDEQKARFNTIGSTVGRAPAAG